MKKNLYQILILVIFFLLNFSVVGGRERLLSFCEDSLSVNISCLTEHIIHVQVFPCNHTMKGSLIVNDQTFRYEDYELENEGKERVIKTPSLIVLYDTKKKAVVFKDRKTGKVILHESSRSFKPVDILGEKSFHVKQAFRLSKDEALYGLGQYQEGYLNYRDKEVKLVQANREIANPVLVSSSNYIIFWDNYSKTLFSGKNNEASFSSEVGDGVSYYFIYGASMKQATAHFLQLTGVSPMLPKSSFGLWVSKERYKTFKELEDVVCNYRKRNIPLDNIVQDWQYWGDNAASWNSMTFNPKTHPQPLENINKLHQKYRVKLALSVWPGVGKDTEIYQKLDSVGALFNAPTWAGYKVVDIYNPIAQKIYWDYLYRGLYTKGVDTWWMDGTEPAFTGGLYQKTQEEAMKKAGMTYWGPIHRYLNTYSLALSKMMFDNLRKVSDKRVSILTRSAFAGQQKYSTITWSGDIYASWNVFRKQIPAGLNLCMTGLPYWTTDIGGFRVKSQEKQGGGGTGELDGSFENINSNDGGYVKGLSDSAYLELYTRWFQYGAFNPIFRVHGTEIPREIWHFGEPGTPYYDAQCDMIRLRYSLLSYIYSMAWKVTNKKAILMRPLVLDFPEDKNVRDDATSYMFGDALLVHPVTFPMYYNRKGKIKNVNTTVSVYLPKCAGKYWYDFNSRSVYRGGAKINYNAPLNILPLFVKAGTIIPINSPSQFATENSNQEMEIRVYSGADAEFVLYEDDNETFNYEMGLYNEIVITWNEKQHKLTLSEVKGKHAPLHSTRTFNIKLINPTDKGQTEEQTVKVLYKNKKQEVQL